MKYLIYQYLGFAAILAAMIKWGSKLVADRISIKWQENKEVNLKHVESEIDRRDKLFLNLVDNYSSNNEIVLEERIEAIKATWNTILKVKDFISPVSFFFTTLLPKEYPQEVSAGLFEAGFKKIEKKEITKFIEEHDDIEQHRPFIGDKSWQLFWVYRTICYRATYLIEKIKDGTHKGEWYHDKNMSDILEYGLTEEQIKIIKQDKAYSFKQTLSFLEINILKEFNAVLSGDKSALDTYKGSLKMTKLIHEKFDPDS